MYVLTPNLIQIMSIELRSQLIDSYSDRYWIWYDSIVLFQHRIKQQTESDRLLCKHILMAIFCMLNPKQTARIAKKLSSPRQTHGERRVASSIPAKGNRLCDPRMRVFVSLMLSKSPAIQKFVHCSESVLKRKISDIYQLSSSVHWIEVVLTRINKKINSTWIQIMLQSSTL